MIDFESIFPEIFLTLSILFLLVFGVYKKDSFGSVKKFTILILFLCIPIVYLNYEFQIMVFNTTIRLMFFQIF